MRLRGEFIVYFCCERLLSVHFLNVHICVQESCCVFMTPICNISMLLTISRAGHPNKHIYFFITLNLTFAFIFLITFFLLMQYKKLQMLEKNRSKIKIDIICHKWTPYRNMILPILTPLQRAVFYECFLRDVL